MKRLIYLLLIILGACNSPDPDTQDSKLIELFPIVDSKFPVITDSIVSDFWILKLETPEGIFVGDIEKLIFTKNRIIISDMGITNSILIFDHFGQFVNQITGGNKGPGEFIRPQSITGDYQTDDLYVFDDKLQKIIHYDKDGNFVGENKFKYVACDISKINNGFAFNSGYPQVDNKINSNDLIFTSFTAKVTNKFLPLRDWRIGSYFNKNNSFTEYKDTTWYSPVYNDTVYLLTQDGPLPYYRFNMGKDFITDKIANKIDLDDPNFEYNHAINNFLKAGDMIYMSYRVRDKQSGRPVSKHVFIDQKTKNVAAGEYLSGVGKTEGLFCSPISTDGDYFVGKIDAFNVKNTLNWSVSRKKEAEIAPEILDLYYNISEADNPVLFFYKVAPF